jgi:hypothetical protein
MKKEIKVKPEPALGYVRIVSCFLWWPLTLPVEGTMHFVLRWLERAEYAERYTIGLDENWWSKICWTDMQ